MLSYYLAKRTQNVEIKESLNIATKAAALTVARKGASDSIPYENEIK